MPTKFYATLHGRDGVNGNLDGLGTTLPYEDRHELTTLLRKYARNQRKGKRATLARIYASETETLIEEIKL